MLWLLARKVAPAILLLLISAVLWTGGYRQGSSKVRAEFEQYKALLAQQNAQAQAELSASFQSTIESRDRALQNIASERDNLLDRLRSRPSRTERQPTSSTGSSSATTSTQPIAYCGPDQLYREDAEFLILFAADAEALRQELLSTREAYESARRALQNSASN